jgi:hypothetical protein
LAGLALLLGALSIGQPAVGQAAKPRRELRRFNGRVQTLSGALLARPQDAAGQRHFAAYVPTDVELGLHASGPVSILLGAAAALAPFTLPSCGPGPAPLPHALAALLGARFDFNNSRDGSWWSPWLALRAGVVGQSGVEGGATCSERFLVGLLVSPRLGIDLWLGKAAVTFAIGYDNLPRAAALSALVGLTLRLF